MKGTDMQVWIEEAVVWMRGHGHGDIQAYI
jgi:hypothetical protein